MKTSLNKKVIYPSESEEQIRFISEIRLNYKDCLIFAIPNGGSRNIIEASRLKKEGIVKGIPDLCLIMPNNILFIEMKKQKGGRLSDSQKEIISKINKNGFDVIIGYGYLDALEKFKNYLKIINI